MLPFIIAGLTTGSVYGLAGVGLVLTYKTSGVFNFAHGALATIAAYLFYSLHVQEGVSWPVAAVLAIFVLGPALGFGLELVARRLARASLALRVACTIGLLLIVQAAAVLIYGYGTTTVRTVAPFLGTHAFHIGGTVVTLSNIVVFAIGVAATTGLYAFFRLARVGVAMRAVVDNPDLLNTAGTNPITVRRRAWMIGSTFACTSGVILAPFITLDSLTLTFLVVAAFGAAAIGAFTSLPGTYLGGLVIGVLASLATKWFTSGALAGLSTALPFLVLFVVLMIGPRRWLAERAPVVPRGHAAWTAPWQVQLPAGLGLLVLLAFVPSFAGLHLQDWTSSVAVAIMYLSLGLLVRTSGQVSLCHVSFMAIGACGFSQLAFAHGWPWGLALITAGLIAVPIGALLSIPSIRLSGLYLALSTFGFGILLQYMFYSQNYMFGTLGLGITIPMPHLPGIGLNGSDKSYYYLVLILGAASTALVIAINRSRLGRLLRGLADSPTGLATSGTSVNVTRVLVFCISAFLAAIAGALQGGAYGTVDAPSYQPITSLVYFTLIIITPGGVPWYAVVAAAGTIIPSYLTSPNTSNWLQLAFGLGVLIYAITPQSRLGTPVPVQNAIDRMTRRRRRPAVHPHAATGTATPPTPATSSRTLQLRDLRVAFGGLVAVDGAGLEAPTGRITGLIGPNGAGKTTTFNACSGLTKPSRGEVTLDGTSLLRYSPSARARRGLGRTFQHMQLFDSLTVRENIALGHEASHAGTNALRHLASSPRTKRNVEKATAEALALCDLTELQDKLAGSLSTGQRRLVELARCLAGPFQILLLDEPSSGLDRAETARFGEILRELVRTRGIGILLVEHDMALVTDICDYVYVLDFGKPIFEGTAAQMLASPTVRAAYLGNDLPPQDPVPARDPATADEEA